MKKTVKILSAILAVLCSGVLGACVKLGNDLPDSYTVNKDENISFFNFNTISFNNQSKKEITVSSTLNGGSFSGSLMLLDIIPIKEVNVHYDEKKFVVPCGDIFGIKFHTKGITIIKCSDITSGLSSFSPGNDCGLQPGDNILSANGENISCCDDFRNIIQTGKGEPIEIEFEREGKTYHTDLTPIKNKGEYKAGLWVRDSCAGLGTMTFYDPETDRFASLGHGICDSDTGELLPLDSAEITKAEISSITKGSDGIPGSINAYFSGEESDGTAFINNETGLYGVLNDPPSDREAVEIANIQDIRKGPAEILCTLDENGPQYYSIEITHVDYDEKNKTKNLQIIATDERLLEKTGGIIQGMSGSPILQNGKLIGAVTHVLVTNSAKGYGIFAQNMYNEIEKTPN